MPPIQSNKRALCDKSKRSVSNVFALSTPYFREILELKMVIIGQREDKVLGYNKLNF